MTMELTLLGWTLVLALAQILLVTLLRLKEAGLAYNMSPRDVPGAPTGKITARLIRAQANLFETLPLFAAAVLIAHAMGRESNITLLGTQLYLGARIVYVPIYAAGICVVRTLTWTVSIVGLVMIFSAILR
ncbi:MAG: MAPEG family protein [Alphaproteobacteria bacterium]|nr:MAPEG family protein [Alphaproteobacteria bacterium]